MKKRTVVWVVLCAFMSLNLAPVVFGQTSVSSPSMSASATVPPFLEFAAVIIKKMDADTGESDPWLQGQDVSGSPSFDFGELRKVVDTSVTPNQFLFMRGQFYYYVLMVAATSGRRYKITESGTQLTGSGSAAGATIANESVLLVPDYQWQDTLGAATQGAPPSGASVGSVASATLATEQLVYQSDNGGLGRWVRAVIAIGGPQATTPPSAVPFNFSLGYNGSAGQGVKQSFTTWKPVNQDQKAGPYGGTVKFTLTLN